MSQPTEPINIKQVQVPASNDGSGSESINGAGSSASKSGPTSGGSVKKSSNLSMHNAFLKSLPANPTTTIAQGENSPTPRRMHNRANSKSFNDNLKDIEKKALDSRADDRSNGTKDTHNEVDSSKTGDISTGGDSGVDKAEKTDKADKIENLEKEDKADKADKTEELEKLTPSGNNGNFFTSVWSSATNSLTPMLNFDQNGTFDNGVSSNDKSADDLKSKNFEEGQNSDETKSEINVDGDDANIISYRKSSRKISKSKRKISVTETPKPEKDSQKSDFLSPDMGDVNGSPAFTSAFSSPKVSNSLNELKSPPLNKNLYSDEFVFDTKYHYASDSRNNDFHELFKSIESTDRLIDDFSCALSKEILIQGRIYISEKNICFNANILGWVTNLIVPMGDIKSFEKKITAGLFHNAITIVTKNTKHNFATFLSRDSTFELFNTIWLNYIQKHGESSESLNSNDESKAKKSIDLDPTNILGIKGNESFLKSIGNDSFEYLSKELKPPSDDHELASESSIDMSFEDQVFSIDGDNDDEGNKNDDEDDDDDGDDDDDEDDEDDDDDDNDSNYENESDDGNFDYDTDDQSSTNFNRARKYKSDEDGERTVRAAHNSHNSDYDEELEDMINEEFPDSDSSDIENGEGSIRNDMGNTVGLKKRVTVVTDDDHMRTPGGPNSSSDKIESHEETDYVMDPETENETILMDNEIFDNDLPTVFDTIFGKNLHFQEEYIKSVAGDIVGKIPEFSHLKEQDVEAIFYPHLEPDLLQRSYEYDKKLGYSIGPKSTMVKIIETIKEQDFDKCAHVIVKIFTPNVPSGGSFFVQTRYLLAWGSDNNTKMKISYKVEWTSGSWFKKVVESNTLSGQQEAAENFGRILKETLKALPSGKAKKSAKKKRPLELQSPAVLNPRAFASNKENDTTAKDAKRHAAGSSLLALEVGDEIEEIEKTLWDIMYNNSFSCILFAAIAVILYIQLTIYGELRENNLLLREQVAYLSEIKNRRSIFTDLGSIRDPILQEGASISTIYKDFTPEDDVEENETTGDDDEQDKESNLKNNEQTSGLTSKVTEIGTIVWNWVTEKIYYQSDKHSEDKTSADFSTKESSKKEKLAQFRQEINDMFKTLIENPNAKLDGSHESIESRERVDKQFEQFRKKLNNYLNNEVIQKEEPVDEKDLMKLFLNH